LQDEQQNVPQNAVNREDRIFRLDGRIEELQNQLAGALAAESNARTDSRGQIVGGNFRTSATEQAFGPRADFPGIQPGFKAAITIPTGPAVTDPSMPKMPDSPRGFADTLNQAPTSGSLTYLRRGAKTNAAAQWDGTGTKPESDFVWTEHTAPLAWIAHHVPITKTQASDWNELDTMIRGEMMIGLAQAKSEAALVGANASGITGVLNTVGIQTHTVAATDNVYDAIRRMVTKVVLTSGFRPTHVAMSPQVKEELDLLKSTVDDHYLVINVGNEVWNLEVVEDVNLTTVDLATTSHYGCIVYAAVGGTWYTKETDNIEVGLVNAQFIQNAYTLLAEGRNALAVRFPDAFVYCADAITAVPLVS
ncbi:MAG TPA: phage major capsid protein, partial [Coriobacteriia bacterium]|nr:phage major capsid protein [Coriobacteriia bacterium]